MRHLPLQTLPIDKYIKMATITPNVRLTKRVVNIKAQLPEINRANLHTLISRVCAFKNFTYTLFRRDYEHTINLKYDKKVAKLRASNSI